MNDAPPKTSKATKRKRGAIDKSAPLPPGDYTSIRVPIPPASAFNKDRPVGCLIQAQLRHIQHAESARLPKEMRDGRRPEDIHTEAEAASYIAAVTKILHPQARKRSRPRPTS
jgi:hypothetical protein